jgi:hypothetical protein
VIPYYTMQGKPEPFYRVRLFDHVPKYKQPKDTPSHIYFPPTFLAVAKGKNYVLIAEGEKKAALACKRGYPCVALGGVDSWRNRTISIPENSELKQLKSKIAAKLPAGTPVNEESDSLATGMQELLDFLIGQKKHAIIVFDSDQLVGVKPPVQRAAASLGFELRFRGVPFNRIRQIVLPPIPGMPPEKIGLDDFLMHPDGVMSFDKLLAECIAKRSAFPRHPSIRDYLNKKLQKNNLTRKETQAVAMAVLSDLDANGIRLRAANESQTYYFDFTTRKLLKAQFAEKDRQYDSSFGQFLYRNYGLSSVDNRLGAWLAAQFTGEDPVGDVSPHRIIARPRVNDDSVLFQLSDSQYAKVTADGLDIIDNGEQGILFESEQVEPVDTEKFLAEYGKQSSRIETPFHWGDVLSEVRLRDKDKHRIIIGLLYYMSPWLNRWRGTQLPVEMIIGESGSGKSTLCELRLEIISGRRVLRNAPGNLQDWHASIANSGGLHVTDNVQLVDRSLKQRLSDEICRIITEADPHIEMRKFYTEADLRRIPVRSVFALTAIQQPFTNADLIQRSIITDFEKIEIVDGQPKETSYDSEWRNNQLERFGGREAWLAHHMVVLQRFFSMVKEKWNPKYKAKHRLINFEQSLMFMAEIFGVEASWIPNHLANTTEKTLSESDWTFEGIKTYVDTQGAALYKYGTRISASTIAAWAATEEEFEKCENLTNSRRLGRYLQIHKTMVAQITGLIEAGTQNNRTMYKIVRPSKKS